jgi:glucose/arabinose dehydrogenase
MTIRPTSVALSTIAAAALALAASAQAPPRDPRAGRGPEDPILKSWAVYDQHCVACHGRNLEGGAAGSLVDGVWKFAGDDAQIAETIREGRKGTAMASFKPVLTEDQIWRLVILIRQEEAEAREHPPTIVDPDGAVIYLSYAKPGPADTSMTAIVRGRIRENRWVDEQPIYSPPPDLYGTPNYHYGSRLLFDREGRLFYSIGDRGQKEAAQDLGSPLGKVHRVNDDGTVPADNPFASRAGAVPSVWTHGHRNPQGLSIDPVSGLLWEAEHGPMGGDEVNILEAGHNYGWPVISHGLEPGITGTAHEGMEPPIVYWNPTIAPSGIHFYDGTRYPAWRHDLFVTGLGGTALRRLEVKGRQVTHQEVLFNRYGRVRDVVTGPDGLLYVALQLPGVMLSSSTPGVIVRLPPVESP